MRARRLLSLSSNGLWGSLPGGWAAPNAFPRLQILRLANNYFSGPLPGAWANPNAFPYMRGSRNGMCGPLICSKCHNISQHALLFLDTLSLPSLCMQERAHVRVKWLTLLQGQAQKCIVRPAT